jgi:phosphohistidine phosphatase
MKRLLLTRHAKTHQASPGEADFDRKLTDRGFSDIALVASTLLKNHYLPQAILASPAQRTRQTALEFSKLLQVKTLQFDDILYGHYTLSQLTRILDREMPQFNSIMVVGHNPTMAMLANNLTGWFNAHMPTTGVFVLDAALDDWNLLVSDSATQIDFVYPKLYK